MKLLVRQTSARFYELGLTRDSRVIPGLTVVSVLSKSNLGLNLRRSGVKLGLNADELLRLILNVNSMVSIRQNIVSLFASSFSNEDHLYFFRVTLRYDLIAVPYLCLQ